jgi:hypothetical protein
MDFGEDGTMSDGMEPAGCLGRRWTADGVEVAELAGAGPKKMHPSTQSV